MLASPPYLMPVGFNEALYPLIASRYSMCPPSSRDPKSLRRGLAIGAGAGITGLAIGAGAGITGLAIGAGAVNALEIPGIPGTIIDNLSVFPLL
tara:strand:- start:51 stop:332 length:282 start_codon:yes stop_codon:yes gene_type:complete